MGLFTVFKLASDYSKVSKFLKSKKFNIDKAKELAEKIKKFIGELQSMAIVIKLYASNAYNMLEELNEIIKKGENND